MCGSTIFAQGLPKNFSRWELSHYGLPAVHPSCGVTCTVDGRASTAEYGAPTRFSSDKGLSFLNSSGSLVCLSEEALPVSSDCYEDVYAAFDGDFFYFATVFSPMAASQICLIDSPLFGPSYLLTLEISMESNENPFVGCGMFTNSYFFSDSACVGVTGTRTYALGSEIKMSGRISSSGNSEIPFSSANLGCWNGEKYREEACFSRDSFSGEAVFECRIPLADLALTMAENERSSALSRLQSQNGLFCGSFALKATVCEAAVFPGGSVDHVSMTTALSASDICPDSENGATWLETLRDGFSRADFDSFQMLSVPLFWSGELPHALIPSPPTPPQTSPDLSDSDSNEGTLSSPVESNLPSIQPPITSLEKEDEGIYVPSTNRNFPDFSSILSEFDVSDIEDAVARTELVFLEEEVKRSFFDDLSSYVLLGAGVLLLCAIVGVAMIFRAAEKREQAQARKNTTKKS